MNRSEAVEYAERWIDDWNRRDVEAVLAHFDEDVTFSSPTALETIGMPAVRGKAALRSYWLAALQRIRSLRFSLERIVWDPDGSELAIIYDRHVNDRHDRASEVLHFGQSGKVVRGEVFHGVATG
jgi:ketosteroid isomerase-like protein